MARKPGRAAADGEAAREAAEGNADGDFWAPLRQFVPTLGTPILEKTISSSVTTEWGVRWDEETIARDLMQNMRDANRTQMEAIETRSVGKHVGVMAPAEFNLMRLFYLGSEKGDGDIGAYGEGAKAASVGLLRDFNVTPIMMSGNRVLVLRLAEHPVEGTSLRPIEYDFYKVDTEHRGTVLLLPNATARLRSAMEGALQHFFWDRHPAIGEHLFSGHGVSVYRAKEGSTDGIGFYMGLKRLTIRRIPIVIAMTQPGKKLEKLIAQDRDRKVFDDKVESTFYQEVARTLDERTILEILRITEPLWKDGHGLLHGIAQKGNFSRMVPGTDRPMISQITDPSKYIAYDGEWRFMSGADRNAILAVLDREKHRVEVPGYFGVFGIMSARDIARAEAQEEQQKLLSMGLRAPLRSELQAIHVLMGGVKLLYAPLASLVANRDIKWEIITDNEVLGMMKNRHRGYGTMDVPLAEVTFRQPLGQALATVLHELSHIFGGDGSRHFTDALTDLLAATIANREGVDEIEQAWKRACDAVSLERAGLRTYEMILRTMTEDKLRGLVEKLPREVVLPLLEEVPAEASAEAVQGAMTAVAEEHSPRGQGRVFTTPGELPPEAFEALREAPWYGTGGQRYVVLDDFMLIDVDGSGTVMCGMPIKPEVYGNLDERKRGVPHGCVPSAPEEARCVHLRPGAAALRGRVAVGMAARPHHRAHRRQ